MTEQFEVLVIGAGPAGYVAAIRSAQLGLRTAIVDKQWLGGVCVNVGCIPSKSLLRNAEIAYTLRVRGKDFGFSFENLQLDYSSAYKRSRQVSERLVKGIAFLMKKNNIQVFFGQAKLLPPLTGGMHQVEFSDQDKKTILISTKNIIISTGASAVVPGGWEPDGKKVITYLEAIHLDHLPASAVIIGAGAIGMEFSTIWNSYGIKTSIIEMMPHILPLEDEEAAAEVAKAYTKRGVEILAGHKVEQVEKTASGVKVTISKDNQTKTIEADLALVAVGFKPNTIDLGLDSTGVQTNMRGFININEKMATNIPGIWAIGDVTGKLMLAHVGSAMGILCAEAIAGKDTEPLKYEMMPKATYCSPQVASFGITEKQAQERGLSVKVGRFPFQANGKALGLGDYAGWVKLVVGEQYGEVLGATLVGPEVTELLPELTLAGMMELTISELARNIHAHPTLSEALMEAAHSAEGRAIHI